MRTTTSYCKHGHERTEENTYIAPKTGAIGCKPCRSLAARGRNTPKHKYLFGGNREDAIQRDGEKCVKCGMTRTQHKAKYGRDITVDHIDGRGVHTVKEDKNNALNNLMTLCLHCHGIKDRARRVSRRIILTAEDARDIRLFRAAGMSVRDIHKAYQMVSYNTLVRKSKLTAPTGNKE